MADMDLLASEIASILGQPSNGEEASSAPKKSAPPAETPAASSTGTSDSALEREVGDAIAAMLREKAEEEKAAPAPTSKSTPAPTSKSTPAPTPKSAPASTPKSAPAPTPKSAPAPTPKSAPAPTPAPVPPTTPTRDSSSPSGERSFGRGSVTPDNSAPTRKKQHIETCKRCGDRTPCKCDRYNRYDFSGVIVTIITSCIAWLFLDYATLFTGEKAKTCAETFATFCVNQDITLLITDFRFIMPLIALAVNILAILFVVLNKPTPIRWIDLIAKLAIIIIASIAAGDIGKLFEAWAMDSFMLGGTVWWIATTVMNFICGFAKKRGRIVDNTVRKGK